MEFTNHNHLLKILFLIIYALVKYIENTIKLLGDTEIAAELRAIYDFYNYIQPDFDSFMERFSLSCPPGCGECCAHFIPDVTPSEALIIGAQVLFGDKKDLLKDQLYSSKPVSSIVCPFYDPWNPSHCMVYSVRPLVCRMFYSCASEGKNGEMEFRGCRFNDESQRVAGQELEDSSSVLQSMSDYGESLEALPGNSASTELLPAAVKRAVQRIGYDLNLLFPDSQVFMSSDQEAL